MNPIKSLCQRLRDWRHERKIKRLYWAWVDTHSRAGWPESRASFELFRDAAAQRSAGQVARMERRLGIHVE